MNVINGLFEQGEVLGRLHRLRPPTSRHDREKQSVLTTRRESLPGSAALTALWERPWLGASPLWLTRGPPFDPLIPVPADVVDDRDMLL